MPGDVDQLNGKKPDAVHVRPGSDAHKISGEPRPKVRCHDYVHCAVKPGHPPLSLVGSPPVIPGPVTWPRMWT